MTGERSAQTAARAGIGARLLPDERLAKRAAAGDRRAFTAIFERYAQPLYRFCASILGNGEEAHDALQNTMVKVLQALPGEKRQIQLKPWLYRIAHNEAIELLRRRRDTSGLDEEIVAAADGPAEAVAQRERLRQLLDDLAGLPERQRGALVMCELSGLGFEQIGEAFGTSAAVARQTVYEARLSLQRLEEGRAMGCGEVLRQISDGDGRIIRRREIQAHLRVCGDCAAFLEGIDARRHDFAAIAPLPALAAAGILQTALGSGPQAGAAGGGAATAGAGAVGAGAGKAVATSVLVKSVATVAVAATVGVSAADRGGLIDAGLPVGGENGAEREAVPAEPGDGAAVAPAAQGAARSRTEASGGQQNTSGDNGKEPAPPIANGTPSQPGANTGAPPGQGPPAELPAASQHGQETATAHKRGAQSNAGGTGRGAKPPSHTPEGAKGGAHGKGNNSGKGPSGNNRGAKPQKGIGTNGKPQHGNGAGKREPAPNTPEDTSKPVPPPQSAGEPPPEESDAPGSGKGQGKGKGTEGSP